MAKLFRKNLKCCVNLALALKDLDRGYKKVKRSEINISAENFQRDIKCQFSILTTQQTTFLPVYFFCLNCERILVVNNILIIFDL